MTFRNQAFGEYEADDKAQCMKSRDHKDATDLIVSPLMSGSSLPAGHNARSGHCKDAHIVPVVMTLGHTESNGLGIVESETANTLEAMSSANQAIGFHARQDPCPAEELLGAIDTDGTSRAVAFSAGQSSKAGSIAAREEQAPTLRGGASGTNQVPSMANGMALRRLTPRECERLQGFPDDYTLIRYRGKLAADGPRYKALGNSWAVPIVRWIGERIQKVEALTERVQKES